MCNLPRHCTSGLECDDMTNGTERIQFISWINFPQLTVCPLISSVDNSWMQFISHDLDGREAEMFRFLFWSVVQSHSGLYCPATRNVIHIGDRDGWEKGLGRAMSIHIIFLSCLWAGNNKKICQHLLNV